MKLLDRIGISTQLYGIVGITMLIGATIGFVTLIGLGEVRDNLETMYVDRVEPLRGLKIVADKYAVDIVDATHKARNGQMSYRDAATSISNAQKEIEHGTTSTGSISIGCIK